MFEFHGWVNIQCTENDEEPTLETNKRQEILCKEIEEEMSKVSWCNGIFKLFRGVNGQDHLIITGFSNHRQNAVIDFLHWLAAKKTGSYGLLHVIDDEELDESGAYAVKVWRLINDELIVLTDQILTPKINCMQNIF